MPEGRVDLTTSHLHLFGGRPDWATPVFWNHIGQFWCPIPVLMQPCLNKTAMAIAAGESHSLVLYTGVSPTNLFTGFTLKCYHAMLSTIRGLLRKEGVQEVDHRTSCCKSFSVPQRMPNCLNQLMMVPKHAKWLGKKVLMVVYGSDMHHLFL